MLKLLRKKGVAKKVIWFIAIVIIISFGFFGTAYLLTGNPSTSYAGKMYGKMVSIDDFNKAYKSTRIQAMRQYGSNLNKVSHLLNLEAQTWDRLIFLHEAKKRKIKITNESIVKSIEEDESFEKNDQFDILLYNAILRNLQIRPRDYEENMRDNLKIAELYKQVTSSVTINEEEVFQEYQNRNEKVQASYVFIDSDSFKENVTLDTAEVEQYYQTHKSEFLVPPSVNVQYLTLDFPEAVESSENSESEDAQDKLEQQKDLIRDKADALFQQLLVNPAMEEVAAQNNLGVDTSGFFSMEQPNLTLGWSYDLLKKIFEMDLNEVNEPFETPTGMSIVQIKEKRDSYVPGFNETKSKVEEAVIKQKSKDIAKTKASEYLVSIREELDKTKIRDFAKAAKALELEIHQTPEFNRGQYLPLVGISKEFEEAAFKLTEDNKLSDVVEISKGYCFLHLDNYVPADKSEYEKAREELAQSISDEKQKAVFGDFAAQLRRDSGLVDNIPLLRSEATQ